MKNSVKKLVAITVLTSGLAFAGPGMSSATFCAASGNCSTWNESQLDYWSGVVYIIGGAAAFTLAFCL